MYTCIHAWYILIIGCRFFFFFLFCFVSSVVCSRRAQVTYKSPSKFQWQSFRVVSIGESAESQSSEGATQKSGAQCFCELYLLRVQLYIILQGHWWRSGYIHTPVYIYIYLYVSTHNALRFSFIQDILWVWAFIYYIIIHIYMYIVCTYIKDKWLLCVVVPAYPYTEEKNRNDFRLCFALFKSVGGSLGSHYLYIIYYNIKHAIKRRRRNPNGKTLTLVVGIRHVCVCLLFFFFFFHSFHVCSRIR